MSFDVYFHTCNINNSRRKEVPNPFAPGEMMIVNVDDGLTPQEVAAIEKVLAQHQARGPNDFGFYSIDMADGGSVELFADELGSDLPCDSLSAAIRGLTPQVVRLLFELAAKGNLVILPVMETPVVAVCNDALTERVRSRWPEIVVIHSSNELGELLQGGYAAWERYRKQVTGEL